MQPGGDLRNQTGAERFFQVPLNAEFDVGVARFVILRQGERWAIDRDGSISGEYVSREIAFEVAAGEVSNAIKVGDRVEIVIEAPGPGQSALGVHE